jgi:hypothetical protein
MPKAQARYSNVVNTSSIPTELEPETVRIVERAIGSALSNEQCSYLGLKRYWAWSIPMFEDNTPSAKEIRTVVSQALVALRKAHEALRKFDGIEQALMSTRSSDRSHRAIGAKAMVFRRANDIFRGAAPAHHGLDFLRLDILAAIKAFQAVPAELIDETKSGRSMSYEPERLIISALADVYQQIKGTPPSVSWNKSAKMIKGPALQYFESCVPALLGSHQTISRHRIGELVRQVLGSKRRKSRDRRQQAEMPSAGD